MRPNSTRLQSLNVWRFPMRGFGPANVSNPGVTGPVSGGPPEKEMQHHADEV